jgi:hypothetical protein
MKCIIVIIIVLVVIIIGLLQDYHTEHLNIENFNNEAIANIASIYNTENMKISNIDVTKNLNANNLNANNLNVNGKIKVTNAGLIRGNPNSVTSNDLGLYSQNEGHWIRYVSNNAPHVWWANYNKGATAGDGQIMTLSPDGHLNVSNNITANNINTNGMTLPTTEWGRGITFRNTNANPPDIGHIDFRHNDTLRGRIRAFNDRLEISDTKNIRLFGDTTIQHLVIKKPNVDFTCGSTTETGTPTNSGITNFDSCINRCRNNNNNAVPVVAVYRKSDNMCWCKTEICGGRKNNGFDSAVFF